MTETPSLGHALQRAILVMIMILAVPADALAQTSGSLSYLIHSFSSTTLSALPKLLNNACFVIGLVMVMSGIFKIKAHAENPGTEKLAPAVVRLVAGGFLTSIPALTGVVQRAINLPNSAISYMRFPIDF